MYQRTDINCRPECCRLFKISRSQIPASRSLSFVHLVRCKAMRRLFNYSLITGARSQHLGPQRPSFQL
uniref:Uncharacterized protein n=1 Tax=Pararge aegeria TaxID=116150 RepID=S4NW59_9NEOP